MIINAYVKWARERSDFDNLSLFLAEFFKGKTDRQVFEHIVFELQNMAAVMGEMDKRLCDLENGISHPLKDILKKPKPRVKRNANG